MASGKDWLPEWTHSDNFEIPTRIPEKPSKTRFLPKPLPPPRNAITEALELKEVLANDAVNRSQLADRLGVSRARVTQLLGLLGLPPDVVEDLRSLSNEAELRFFTERRVREILRLRGHDRRRKEYMKLKKGLAKAAPRA